MVWNHRVVRRDFGGGEVHYSIHEVYYDEPNGPPRSCTMEPVAPYAESVEKNDEDQGLRWVLERMLAALDKPVLDWDEIGGLEFEPDPTGTGHGE